MQGIKVYGHSDDLIEVEGAVEKEFYASYGESDTLLISPGYKVEIDYDKEAEWKIDVIESPGQDTYKVYAVESEHRYSQVLHIPDADESYTAELKGDTDA